MTENTITEQDTWDHFIGSGALSYGWYAEVDGDWGEFDYQDGRKRWQVTFEDGEAEDDAESKQFTLDHGTLMTVVKDLAHKWIDGYEPVEGYAEPHSETRRQCAQFLADKEYTDFDAATADQVMQVAAFGKILY